MSARHRAIGVAPLPRAEGPVAIAAGRAGGLHRGREGPRVARLGGGVQRLQPGGEGRRDALEIGAVGPDLGQGAGVEARGPARRAFREAVGEVHEEGLHGGHPLGGRTGVAAGTRDGGHGLHMGAHGAQPVAALLDDLGGVGLRRGGAQQGQQAETDEEWL